MGPPREQARTRTQSRCNSLMVLLAGAAVVTLFTVGRHPHPSASHRRFPADLPFLEALAGCETLECVRDAHAQPRHGAQLNFPHFFIIGFQKAATTSLFWHLAEHPQLLPPSIKEPKFLTQGCQLAPEACPLEGERDYIRETLRLDAFVEAGGRRGAFEGSTHYVRNVEHLAGPLLGLMPWLKLVVSLREPISRAISMLVHNAAKSGVGCLMHEALGDCLINRSQVGWTANGTDGGPTNYSDPLRAWLSREPRDKFHVIQYEELTSDEGEAGELRRVKKFLGIDPSLPKKSEMQLLNSRRFKIQPQGHRVPEAQYKQLVAAARRDAAELIALLREHGQLRDDGGAWMARWERVWKDNLATCDGGGVCTVQLS